MNAPLVKTCSRCGKVKPLDDFYRVSKTSDRRMAACKTCRIAATTRSRLLKAAQ